MAISRRQFVKLLGTISAGSPAILSACADDDPEVSAADGGVDATADAGMVDTGMTDAGDVASDVTPGPIYTDDDWTTDPIEPDSLPAYEFSGTPGPADTFAMGVASGDPTSDSVILWTHVSSPESSEVTVWWEIARDPDFVSRVQVGEVVTSRDRDFTVKVDVTDLLAGRPYYYRFKTAGVTSISGRTRTAPAGHVRNLRFAVCSCACYTSGYYHAYRSIAERTDLHAVIHLGDYIYEGGERYLQIVDERLHVPTNEIRTLQDYRERYKHYRSDADLQEVHRQHPFICVWDDHETKNNSWQTGADNEADPQVWELRKQAAYQAMIEWLPIREQENLKIWRDFSYGDLADIIMLDTRIWGRDEQAAIGSPELDDPTRTILGDDQEAWLADRLCASTAKWKVIGQQVMMVPFLVDGGVLNNDQWDGYPGSRQRMLETLDRCNVDNVVVLTGDIHSSWANDIPTNYLEYDAETGEGSRCVEFVCSSITTQSLGQSPDIQEVLIGFNPYIRWVDLSLKGYITLDLTEERAQAAWTHFDTVLTPDRAATGEKIAKVFASVDGSNRLVEEMEAAVGSGVVPEGAG